MASDEVIVTHNFDTLERFFLYLPTKMRDRVDKFWETTAHYMQREIVKGFQQEKDPDGMPWAANSKLTLHARKQGRKGKRGAKILQDNGIMIKSNVAVQVSPTELKIENRLPYAAPNQFGAKMRITRTQAWWMTFNLFGFDPKQPWKFMSGKEGKDKAVKAVTKLFGKKGKYTNKNAAILLKPGSAWASYHGWKRAVSIANALIGQALVIPARVFLGFSKKNEKDIVKIWTKWFSKIVKEK